MAAFALLYLVVGIRGSHGARYDFFSAFWYAAGCARRRGVVRLYVLIRCAACRDDLAEAVAVAVAVSFTLRVWLIVRPPPKPKPPPLTKSKPPARDATRRRGDGRYAWQRRGHNVIG